MDAQPGKPHPLTRADAGLALAIAGVALAVYRATLTPSLSYLSPDGNELATVPFVFGLAHSPGYPLYTPLGWLFTWLPLRDGAPPLTRPPFPRPAWWLAGAAGFALGLAQFAWLPFRAETLNDRMLLARAPVTLQGIYDYTLGAFPQFKFAFPLTALPDRLVTYLDLLRQEFGPLGIAAGIAGLASLLFPPA